MLGESSNQFKINTLENNIPKVKYIITLDADTDLVLNTGFELIGAMAHILNQPVLNNEKNRVIDGFGIMQPRIGINLDSCRKSIFTKIYAGSGGTDSYTNAVSDIYQDNFGEGIFTGKGIYELETFNTVLKKEIPENTVLSHDLLEGCYLRCGLVSDIMLMDGYPTTYNAFKTRTHRWIRGDYQILKWLKNRNLNLLSKFKIFDNIVRSSIEIFSILSILILAIVRIYFNITIWLPILIIIVSNTIPTILEIINKIIFRRDGQKTQKTFTRMLNGIKASLIRGLIAIAILPDKAYTSFSAACKSIYRMCYSKKHLLEWITAEEAEKNSKTDLLSYYKSMVINIIIGIIGILFFVETILELKTNINNEYTMLKINYWSLVLSVLWILAPYIMWRISKPILLKPIKLQQTDTDYLIEIGKRTWLFFKDNLVVENNFLPPDNYQEDRNPKIIKRTSPTNIGLAILAVISSYDMKYESLEDTLNLLEKMINTIEKLPKWNGHLYNWYDIETLKPATPQYISSVDSGNFVGYLYILKSFLNEFCKEDSNQKSYLINQIEALINNTDFSKLYNEKNRLFSIGFNVEENKLTDSYYDLLASEARQTSLIAIAKKDVTAKHWYNLGRTLTVLNKYKGLISWSGTSFEYLMPTVNVPQYLGSLLDESVKFMIMSQNEYSKKLEIPWGISESAFNLKDLNNNYQYKAFGIPWLGLKRGLADEIVVSSYGSILALNILENDMIIKQVIKNLKLLENEKMLDKYGLYESIDYTPTRVEKGQKSVTVKTYMAHHQGLILASINNFFNNLIFQKRFTKNPEIQAIDILLQERMPENVIITKEKKEKIEKIKYKDYENYIERVYTKNNELINHINLISNNDYQIVIDQKGEGYSKYKDKIVNRFKQTSELEQGIFFFLKNVNTKNIWTSTNVYNDCLAKPDKYVVSFMPDKTKFLRVDRNIVTKTSITTGINAPVEIRRMELKNNGDTEELLEVTAFLEPVLSSIEQDYAHMAFNNLFFKMDYIEDKNIVIGKRKARTSVENDLFIGVKLSSQGEVIGDYEYEISKEKFFGRSNTKLPQQIISSKPFSKQIGLTTDPIIAIRRNIKLNPSEKAIFDLIICVGDTKEYVIDAIESYSSSEKIKMTFELSKARVEEETRYLQLTGKNIELYQRILQYLLFKNPLKVPKNFSEKVYKIEDLWKYGISGDLPILLIKIKNISDINIVGELIKAYEFYRAKNVEIDLVIINEEKGSYENYVQEAIQETIYNRNIGYLQNVKAGIFILKNIPQYDREMLEERANIWFDAHLGNIKIQLDEMEEEYLENTKITLIESAKTKRESEENKLLNKNLKYYNEYGGFSQDGKEYLIKTNAENKLPTVWSHILANERFGTLLTENMGGYTWYKNSKLNRITAWSNDQIMDIPSEIIFIQDEETLKICSIGVNPVSDNNDYYSTYGFGYAKYNHISNGIEQELEIFVPIIDSVKVNLLHLKNTLPKRKKIKLYYCIKPVLGEDEIKTNRFISSEFNKNCNCCYIKNNTNFDYNNIIYFSSSEKIKNVQNSNVTSKGIEILQKKENNNINLEFGNFIKCEIEIELEAFSNKDISIVLGAEEKIIDCKNMAYKYSNINNCYQEYEKVKKYWQDILNKVQVQTPIESINIMLNGWSMYQTLVSRILGRTGFYQSGGAYGFRDQLQDVICLKYSDVELVKKQIIKHSEHQFEQGDVEHWWHDETQRGIRTRFSDDLLWLPYIVTEYINFTGDYSILDIETNYLNGKLLEEGIDENYDRYEKSELKENIFKHCIRAIEKALNNTEKDCGNFGENGLPKIGSGDWNDGFSTVGNKGKGESIWLGFFLYDILEKFIQICEYKEDFLKSKRYKIIAEKLKKSLNTNGWDGRWYRRAFMDNGEVLGSIENEECRIDSIAQTWATISKAGDNDKKYISMESLENHLIDKENGIIKLLDPPFESGKLEPGYIKSYLPGTRENGGQYTHAAIWVIIAEAILGFGNKACELYRMINPIEHSRTRAEAEKYKVEPYVIPADVYGQSNLVGRGGWTWYTGSSSWFYEAGVKYILGIQIEKGVLKINPCIANEWKEYEVKLKYGESIYNIKVKNPNGKNTDIEKFLYNGDTIEEKQIKISKTSGINEIEIIM